ncbi:HDL132Cp [Eremothecium sinecaudum]|uniref:peptidylprolyl isomerase n=1 Tax=Eremothecium sinecaudum TaxID=45286 RepID=A0A109UX08_9SACH|nr:HDL132Cp [Eremothecium sinecaudum]AMD20612.1 HDL132Cp [Eremothecium sinecaudum]
MASNKKVYLDIGIDDEAVGRVVCTLFSDKAPKTTEQFLHLCKGDISIGDRQLTYKGNHFHRVIKNFMVQAGDVLFGSDTSDENLGRGGCSIYTSEEELQNMEGEVKNYGCFEDENLGEFDKPFYLAMANQGEKDTNSSQFFIVTATSPHLNSKHSIFGEVDMGKYVIRTIESVPVDEDGVPKSAVVIQDCGEWTEGMEVPLYNACNDTVGGDIYEELPGDDTHFNTEDLNEAYKVSQVIKESGTLLFKKKDFQNAYFKYIKSLKYINEFIPDIDFDKDLFEKFTMLKTKVYLNLTLVLYNLKRYKDSITYADFLLEMDDVPKLDIAKAHYRKGNCHLIMKRPEEALSEYKECKKLNPDDVVVEKKILEVENKIAEQLEKTKKSISKFFT